MRWSASGILLGALFVCAAAAQESYDAGKALFERKWEDGAQGLGPLFNAKSCNGCHKDGGAARIFRLDGTWIARGAVVRIGARGGSPDPRYGAQLQDIAVDGLDPEATIGFDFSSDASFQATLLKGEPSPDSKMELRLAPSIVGRARIEAVDPAAIVAGQDPADQNGDGISGRAHKLFDGAVGKFGVKAKAPSLVHQTLTAAFVDMGLSSTLFPVPHGECTALDPDCQKAGGGNLRELTETEAADIVAFLTSLAPKPRVPHPEAESLLAQTGCAACHVPELPNAAGEPQRIYSDLLLHDMGEALGGSLGEEGISPAEWRTAPLLDLDPLDGHRRYLHDGRAASIDDAILLHGGEGAAARDAYAALTAEQRHRLLTYLAGL